MDVGQISVTLGLNSSDFISELENAEKEITKLEKNLKNSQEQFEYLAKAMAATENPSKELTESFKKIKTQLKQDQNAFNDFNKKLEKFGGGMKKGTGNVNLFSGAIGKLLAGGSIIALTKQIIDFGAKSVDAFRTQKRAIEGLNNSLINARVYSDEYSIHLQKLSSEIQSYSNYGDEAIQKAIGLGQSFAGNIKLTDELIKSVVDYAAATEQDLDSAFTMVGKSIGTNTNALARYGVELDKGMTKEQKAAEITRVLSDRFSDQAKTMTDTSVQLENAVGDLSESFGAGFNPTVEGSQRLLIKLVNFAKKTIDVLNKWYGNYIEWVAKIRKMDPELLKQKVGYTNLADGITASSKKIVKSSKKISDSVNMIKSATKQDKATEEYKRFFQQYQKLTSDYEINVKARQYVEGTLSIDPVKQQQEYEQLLKVYQSYYSRLNEISKSGAKNKAALVKLEEENLARQLQEIRFEKEQETQRKLYNLQKGYQDKTAQLAGENELNKGFWGGLLGDAYKQKLELEKWYQNELAKIKEEFGNNIQAQEQATAELDRLRTQKLAQDNLNTWQQYGSDVSNIFSSNFSDILSGNKTFSDAMKQLMSDLYQELVKMALKEALKEIEISKMKQAALAAINGLKGFLGGLFGGAAGGAAGMVGGFGGGAVIASIDSGIGPIARVDMSEYLPKYHSGGIVPGTKEQLAVLKGGERVLNPAENTSYSNNSNEQSSGVNNIMMFNIKAWDGKDVIQTLKANSQTINQIVSSGIKNNNQGLRTTVQNI